MKTLNKIFQKHNVIGATCAIFDQYKLHKIHTYGFMDQEQKKATVSNTIYRLASLSKMVTATAIMQLWEQHLFLLDDDISPYIGFKIRNPLFKNHPITFRQLLTHTASLLDNGAYDQIIANPLKRSSVTLKDLLHKNGRFFSKNSFAHYAPGEAFSYSNLGSVILGSIVELLSQKYFCDYCYENIFVPLKMQASFHAHILKELPIAVLYRQESNQKTFSPVSEVFSQPIKRKTPLGTALSCGPAGNLYSSITDFSKFMIAHINFGSYQNQEIIKPTTAKLMHSLHWQNNNHPLSNTLDGYYQEKGLHFQITKKLLPSQTLIGHAGEAYGLISGAYFCPKEFLGFAFAINGGSFGNATPFLNIEHELAKTLFTLSLKYKN